MFARYGMNTCMECFFCMLRNKSTKTWIVQPLHLMFIWNENGCRNHNFPFRRIIQLHEWIETSFRISIQKFLYCISTKYWQRGQSVGLSPNPVFFRKRPWSSDSLDSVPFVNSTGKGKFSGVFRVCKWATLKSAFYLEVECFFQKVVPCGKITWFSQISTLRKKWLIYAIFTPINTRKAFNSLEVFFFNFLDGISISNILSCLK